MGHLQIINHPLASDKLSRIRNKNLDVHEFRRLVQELSIMLAIEATAQCRLIELRLETPLEETTGQVLAREIVLVPILRAGLGMLDGFLSVLPSTKVGYLGIFRDETSLAPVSYYTNLPNELQPTEIFVLDPMLATGGSADYCLSLIKNHGGTDITFVSLIAAPEGVVLLHRNHPDVRIITASLDRTLNEKGYILPGLGDAGDRLNGTNWG